MDWKKLMLLLTFVLVACAPVVTPTVETLVHSPTVTMEVLSTYEPTFTPIPTLIPEEPTFLTWEEFPYVDQVGDDATYINDCGSASILMVAKYYGVAGDETVDEIHFDMMKGDLLVAYPSIVSYLEDTYHLETKMVTTYDWVLIALEENGWDISEIELVDDIPHDRPVIWAYSTEAHWVVRYRGWNFDPYNGIFLFSTTEVVREIDYPEWGLGIYIK